ncbi:MAG TPA: TlpA disulfide reductase family protein [Terracidiphilus sp.]|nr:TlpA disulfide reductase family protein [Terracidiphilus sp.]
MRAGTERTARRLLRGAALGALLLAGVSCEAQGRPAVREIPKAPAASTLVHRRAPEFARRDLVGRRIDLKAYRGKVVLLNFWATWCGPCLVELPRFAAWQREHGAQGLQVLAVSMDDSATPVKRLVKTLKPGFPVMMGDAALGRQYGGVLGLPVTFVIGRDGRIAERLEGGADLPALEQTLKTLLAKH